MDFTTLSVPALNEDGTEAITGTRFMCEIHDEPGECTPECAALVSAMAGDTGIDWYDPTGCSYPAPRPWEEFHFDADAKAVLAVTFTPVGLLDEETYARLVPPIASA